MGAMLFLPSKLSSSLSRFDAQVSLLQLLFQHRCLFDISRVALQKLENLVSLLRPDMGGWNDC